MKYYKPNIEELRIGYELEINWSMGYGDVFTPTVIGYKKKEGAYTHELSNIVIALDDGYAEARVPYLTKEQIEAEGWNPLPDLSPFTGKQYKWRKSEEMGFNEIHIWTLEALHGNPTKIHLEWESSWNSFNDYIFQGKCNDINTLRYISKLLGIEKASD